MGQAAHEGSDPLRAVLQGRGLGRREQLPGLAAYVGRLLVQLLPPERGPDEPRGSPGEQASAEGCRGEQSPPGRP